LSLIADSLKKAVKEKTFDVSPGINLLKNLGSKATPTTKYDPKEIKRFVLLIVIPATILLYLLLAKPFAPKKSHEQELPPVVAKTPAPSVSIVPPAVPKKSPPPPSKTAVQKKEPKNIPIIEPGMKEVPVQESVKKVSKPKLVAGPKKKLSQVEEKMPEPPIAEPLISEMSTLETPEIASNNKTELSKTIKVESPKKVAKTLAKAPAAKTGEPSFPITPEPDIFKNSDYFFNRAIFYQQSRNWEKALTNYSKAAQLDAKNPDIYNNMGVIYKEMRQYDRAIDEFLSAIYLDSNYAKPYNNIGVVYYAKKDFQSAIRNYQKAISIEPKNLDALNNLAVAHKRLNQFEKSKEILNQALKTDTNHAGTNYNLAVLFEKEGNQKSAIHFYQRFIELGSSSHPTLSTQVKKHIEALK
jgi:tetratricopeptide (TPR) repeat protein